MIELQVSRQQYGVGQGNFHFQELVFSKDGKTELTYCFVYDCGGYEKAIEWCVDHATEPKDLKIDAVYLSHFESDHVNGLTALCANAKISRIYVPHITTEQAVHVVAMQIAKSNNWSIELQNFVTTVVSVASGGSINGVPVTQIEGGEAPLSPQAENSDVPQADSETDGVIQAYVPEGPLVRHNERATIKATTAGRATGTVLWEMVHWYYAAHSAISTAILNDLNSSPLGFVTKAEPGLKMGASSTDTAATLDWVKTNYKAIAAIYKTVMKAHNASRVTSGDAKVPNNHNVASLCLYSGPVPSDLNLEQYSHWPYPFDKRWIVGFGYRFRQYRYGAWLATGDAMLKRPDIWSNFEAHFTEARLDACLTVQIPHHGADAKDSDNYNTELIRPYQNCVISAGAKNKYRHPHKNVVNHILAKPAILRLVNENNHIGFVESLKFQFP
jgi:hypothetical protein